MFQESDAAMLHFFEKEAILIQLRLDIEALDSEKAELLQQRESYFRLRQELNNEIFIATHEKKRAQVSLQSILPRTTFSAYETLLSIVREDGVIGLDNLEFAHPNEAATNNHRFYVIVDTNMAEARIIKEIQSEELGAITVLSLQKLPMDDFMETDDSAVPPTVNRYSSNHEKLLSVKKHDEDMMDMNLMNAHVDARNVIASGFEGTNWYVLFTSFYYTNDKYNS
jgi:chromosome segregation ATPase